MICQHKMPKKYYHFLLILLVLSIPVFSSPDFDGSFRMLRVPMFQKGFLEMVLLIIFFYLNYLFLMPQFFYKKKYFWYALMVMVCFLAVVFVPEFIIDDQNRGQRHFPPPTFGANNPVFIFTRSILPFSFSLLSSMFLHISIQKREMEMQKSKAELLNIKYQLQPHFLFNILNSIYSLSLVKSDATPESILRLSNVMRYIVTESEHDLVPLEKEIGYIKDYIELQLMRTDDSLDFSFQEAGNAENLNIAPMILVNFIENAFKYGFNAEKKSKISIVLSISKNWLELNVYNDKVIRNDTGESATYIGLKNTIKRLEELYPGKHSLNIHETTDSFAISLKIDLS